MNKRVDALLDFLNTLRNEDSGLVYSADNRIDMYNSRNVANDRMTNIYFKDGIMVDACYGNMYIEIFGLTADEYAYVYEKVGM